MSYECPHGVPMYLVKDFGCDDCLNDQIAACRGIHIAGEEYSGCNANETGATDCPVCGELVKARKRMEVPQ